MTRKRMAVILATFIIGLPALGQRGQPKLSPFFVEWLMGVRPGHVTTAEIGLTVNQQLKALGNGVVPAQAVEALRFLLSPITPPSCIITDDQSSIATVQRREASHGEEPGRSDVSGQLSGIPDAGDGRHDHGRSATGSHRPRAVPSERQPDHPRSRGSEVRRSSHNNSREVHAHMNDPVQKLWNDISPGDLVSPDGQSWYRVTGRTDAAFDLHGPIDTTGQAGGMEAGQAIPGATVDLAAAVWAISTVVAPTPPAPQIATTTPQPPTAPSPVPATPLPPAGAVSNDELAAGMIKLAKRLDLAEQALRELGAHHSGAATALAAIARKSG